MMLSGFISLNQGVTCEWFFCILGTEAPESFEQWRKQLSKNQIIDLGYDKISPHLKLLLIKSITLNKFTYHVKLFIYKKAFKHFQNERWLKLLQNSILVLQQFRLVLRNLHSEEPLGNLVLDKIYLGKFALADFLIQKVTSKILYLFLIMLLNFNEPLEIFRLYRLFFSQVYFLNIDKKHI